MASSMKRRLDEFRLTLNVDIAFGTRTLTVRGDDGSSPVVAALDEERLSVVLRRVENLGGYADVFSQGPSGVRHVVFMDVNGALDTRSAERMTDDEQPSADSSFGLFADYLAGKKDGVVLPARLRRDGMNEFSMPERQAELVDAHA